MNLADNPLLTRQDVIDAALALIQPVRKYLTPGKSRLMLSATTAHYDEAIAGMEGFSRVLFAIIAMLAGKVEAVEPIWQEWREGMINGVNPDSDEYWGDIGPFDQRMVEMATYGMGMALAPDRFYHELPEDARRNLYAWLNQINRYDMPRNNWKFFRVMVNVGFLTTGCEADMAMLQADLDELETHYTRDGWYFDAPTQRDYYTIWAFHFFSLIYSRVMAQRDPERCERFRERARLMMPRFACWFDRDGRALPYGRSLTYRFAQSDFWAACALAGVTAESIGYGQIKGFLLRNLRSWLAMPILDREGILTVGYGYPNLVASEGYNSPGSPYWGMKVFVALALGEEHPFWQAEEKPYTPPARFCDEEVRLLLTRDDENRQVVAYTAGNHAWEHMHEDEKYEKFAYSSKFGFSVIKEASTLGKGAFDSMLVVRRAGKDLWHGRSGCDAFSVTQQQVTFTWRPMEGVCIDTALIPVDGHWHVRRHVIRTDCEIEAAEAAFAVARDKAGARPCERVRTACVTEGVSAVAHGPFGTSCIYGLAGYEHASVIHPEPNTNMIEPRTVLPTLTCTLRPGTAVLVCAVFTSTGDEKPECIPEEVLQYAQ
ncbi:MAG: DUF2264 domain-containing protein [bacterium]|nr:DUF2264 domain-containing protein [bacterium]